MFANRYRVRVASLVLPLFALLLVSASARGQVTVKDNHITYNGVSYFRGQAEDVELASYGDKKSPLTKTNYLEVHGVIPAGKFKKVERVDAVSIDTSKTSRNDLFANINVMAVFGVNADTAWTKVQQNQLKLVKFRLGLTDVKNGANDAPQALSNLATFGNGARIAHEIWVVMDAKTADTFKSSTDVTLSATDGKIKVTAGASNQTKSTTEVVLPKGSTFAYLLCKIDWENGKKQIKNLTDDQWSLD